MQVVTPAHRHAHSFQKLATRILAVALFVSMPAALWGQFLYVASAGSNEVFAQRIGPEGMLTAVPGSPFVTGRNPAAAIVDPSHRFLYIANAGSNDVSGYAIDAATGALTRLHASPFAAGLAPSALAVETSGRYLYAVNAGSQDVSVYTIDPATGSLEPVPGSPFPVANAAEVALPQAGAIVSSRGASSPDASGRILYAADAETGELAAYLLDAHSDGKRLLSAVRLKPASPAVKLSVAATADISGTELVTAFTLGPERNDLNGWLGMKFTTGADRLNIAALGRVYIQGNIGVHTLKLVRVSDGAEIARTAVTELLGVDLTRQFVYAPLARPVTLEANTAYYLLSQETAGGDQWYPLGPVTTTGVVTVNSAVAGLPAGGYLTIGAGSSYGPVNLLYSIAGVPPTVAITSPADGTLVSGNNVAVAANAAAGPKQTLREVQFQIDSATLATASAPPYSAVLDLSRVPNGAHVLTALAIDTANNSTVSAPVRLVVNNSPSVMISTPASGQAVAGSAVMVRAGVSAASGLSIQSLQFNIDNVPVATLVSAPYGTAIDVSKIPNGPHTLSAVVTDSAGNTSSASISITVNNVVTTVSITAPMAGAVVSGPLVAGATAVPGTGASVRQVQFQVDDSALGSPVTAAPYLLTLDTTTLTNGAHTLTALATDSNGYTASSVKITITVANGALPSAGAALVTGYTPAEVRNDLGGWLGMNFTVGAGRLSVSAVGRICVAGNSGTHVVKLVRAGADVAGGSAAIPLTDCVPGQFVYRPLASPVLLLENTAYSLVSQEAIGGDQWYPLGPVTSLASVASITSGVASSAGNAFQAVGSANTSYGPVNLTYVLAGTPPSVAITSPGDGAFLYGTTAPVTAVATAGTGQTLKQVQFLVDNNNVGAPQSAPPFAITLDTTLLANGSHTLTAVAVDQANNSTASAPVHVNVNNSPAVSLSAPTNGQTVAGSVTLSAVAWAVTGLSVSGLQFRIDGNNVGPLLAAAPYTMLVDTTQLSNGAHLVSAVVTDNLGNTNATYAAMVVNNTSTSVLISEPSAGVVISGATVIKAIPTPGTGVTIKQVQFQIDGANAGAAVTSPPYQLTLDTTTLVNGAHTIVAIATDSTNHSASSAPLSITVSNGVPTPLGNSLVTGFTLGAARNDLSGWLGMKFTVGPVALNVSALGRMYVPGNTGTHTVKLVAASTGADVPGGAVNVNVPAGAAGQFAYVVLAAPVTLAANTAYYLVSQEAAGADQWYPLAPVTSSTAATINSGIAGIPGDGYLAIGSANTSYIPVNLIYTLAGIPPTVSLTAPTDGITVSNIPVTVTAIAQALEPGQSIRLIQFQLDQVNLGAALTAGPYTMTLDTSKLADGAHQLTAVAIDTANNTAVSAPVRIVVHNNTTP